jgi:DNA damage-inducible protein 1
MLKRHQACIDLEKNCLRIQGREVRFLAEHELPDKARRIGEEQVAEELGQAGAAGKLPAGGVAPPNPASDASTTRFPGTGATLGQGSSSAPSTLSPAGDTAITAADFPEADIQAVSTLLARS